MSASDALLKGMLGIGISEKNNTTAHKPDAKAAGGKAIAKGGGSVGKDEARNKKKLSKPQNNANATPGKSSTSRGKTRAGSQGRRSRSGQGTGREDDADDGGDEVVDNNKSSDKSKRKKKNRARQQGASSGKGGEGDAQAKQTPSASEKLQNTKKFSSSKHNAANYAWSAFQSSPDPSALPDPTSLGLFGEDGIGAEGGDTSVAEGDKANSVKTSDDGNVDAGGDPFAGGGARSNLNLPPSDNIRTSLVNSMMAKKGNPQVNAGEALLQRLTSPERQQQAPGDTGDEVNTMFRTMESVEAEMLSPQKRGLVGAEKGRDEISAADNDKPDAPQEDMAHSSKPKERTEVKTQQPEQSNYEYRDPIMELMNPGGHPGGYGMPMQQQFHQPLHHHPQMQYQQPLHYGGNHPMQPYGGYPYPPQMHHPPPPYHHHQHPPPPHHGGGPHGYTTVQVRVPPSLGPGNTMMVHGMSIPVPDGVPPGAIIPVMIPVQHPPGGNHNNPGHHNPGPHAAGSQDHYAQQHQQVQPHHNMMGQYNHNPAQQHGHNQHPHHAQHAQQHPADPKPNTWAAKVAASPSKKETQTANEKTAPVRGKTPANSGNINKTKGEAGNAAPNKSKNGVVVPSKKT